MPSYSRPTLGQPQGVARIDWGNPLNAGLVFAFDGNRPNHEVVTGDVARLTAGGAPTLVQSGDLYRAAYLTGAAADNLQWGDAVNATSSPVNGVLSGATESTVEILFRPRSVGLSAHLFNQWNLGSGNHWLVQQSTTGLLWVAAEDGSSNRRRWDASSLFTAHRWHRLILSWRGGADYTACLDGRSITLTAVNTAATSIRTSANAIRIAPNTGGTPNHDVALARVWNRGFSERECIALAESAPFAFYEPRRIWVPVGAPSGGSTYDVTLTEAATASDAITAAGLFAAAAAESITAADAIAAAQAVAVAQAEAASASEAISTGSVTSNTLTEAVTAADSLAALAALGGVIGESVTVTDLVVSTLAAVAAVAEAASASDQQTTGPVVSGAMVEAVSTADALQVAASLVAQIAESATAGDVMQSATDLVALLTEAATAADSLVAAAPTTYSVTLTELATALDQIVAAMAGDSAFAGAVFRTARGTSTTRAVKGAARNSIRGYQ